MSAVLDRLEEERVRAESAYAGAAGDIMPVASGALSGGLVGNLGMSLKDKPGMFGKRMAVLGGAAVGGLTGYIMNRDKVKKAKSAKKFLERREKMLGKTSEEGNASKGEMLANAGIGGAIGGGLGALVPLAGSKKKTAILGATIGIGESFVGDGLGNLMGPSQSDEGRAAKTAVAFGAAASASPLVENIAFANDKEWTKSIAGDTAKRGKVANLFVADAGEAGQGMKGIGKRMAVRGAIGGALGAGLSYAMSKGSKALSSKKEEAPLRKTSMIGMSYTPASVSIPYDEHKKDVIRRHETNAKRDNTHRVLATIGAGALSTKNRGFLALAIPLAAYSAHGMSKKNEGQRYLKASKQEKERMDYDAAISNAPSMAMEIASGIGAANFIQNAVKPDEKTIHRRQLRDYQ